MNIINGKNIVLLFATLISIVILSNCKLPTIARYAETDISAIEIVKSSASITLEWDYQSGVLVNYYNLYYKAHGSNMWKLVDSVSVSPPEFTIDFDSLGNGSWDFGVTAVDSSGKESEIHSSLDSTADPESGWYLTWTN